MQIFDHPNQPDEGKDQGLPGLQLIIGVVLAGLRFFAFHLIHVRQSHDAQWQLDYWPLWILDLPISIGYFVTPIPFGEAVVGTVWWFSLPLIIWKWRQIRKTAARKS